MWYTKGLEHDEPMAVLARRLHRILLSIPVVLAVAGCASPQAPDPPGNPGGATDPAQPDPAPGSSNPSAGQRAQSAVEGMLMGAVIGGQAGPIGAAVGAGTMLIYSAITGKVPFQDPGGTSGPGGSERQREATIEEQIETEIARQDSLEAQIQEELRRQEELLRQIEQDEAARATPAEARVGEPETTADPRQAPDAPRDRDIPLVVFGEERIEVPKGSWGNDREFRVTRRSLDADEDGAPEEVRYFDEQSGLIVRKEQDRDYDGRMDAWTRYQQGDVMERELDENGDGASDVWEHYAGGRMTQREIDRDGDGHRDAFYRFEAGSLVEERHDTKGDGRIDRTLRYESRRLVASEEDRDGDGRIDTWTRYDVVDGREVVARIEKDTEGRGTPDTFETYQQLHDQTVLARREEDKNGDGVIDVTSIYENGKLVRREIADPALVPL